MKVILLIILLIPIIMLQTYMIEDVFKLARRSITRRNIKRNYYSVNTYDYYGHFRVNKNNIRAVK